MRLHALKVVCFFSKLSESSDQSCSIQNKAIEAQM